MTHASWQSVVPGPSRPVVDITVRLGRSGRRIDQAADYLNSVAQLF